MSVQRNPTEIVIKYLRTIEAAEAKIAELASTADRHDAVVRELIRSSGVSFWPIPAFSKKLLAESLRVWIAGSLLPTESETVVRQLAEVSLEQVDWDKVAQSCLEQDDDQVLTTMAA